MNNLKAQCRAKTLWAWSFGLGGLCLAISPLPLRYGLGVKSPWVPICDEWPAVRMWCKKQGITIADDFLLRMGSEGRKFNKLPIFCSQSGNTKALGLEGLGDFLENFILIRLQRVAVKYARNLPDRSIIQWLQSTAYGMLIGR